MSVYDDIYALVRQIPRGKVSSYGRVAAMIDAPRNARVVGYALAALDGRAPDDVPWWRVVNAAGRVSNEFNAELQRAILESEGVTFDARGYVDLAQFLWRG